MSEVQMPVGNRRSVLSLAVNSKSVLYAAYMPFLKGGGIFLPTNRVYRIGDEVFLLLQLMDDPAKLPIQGTVAWVTPADAQGGKQQGIGLRFGEDDSSKAARTKIESVVGSHLGSTRQTHTL
ncbi:MAG: PilZ domain-containing protein [Gammaproteobacteria bacterium]|jgi:type IV pilus assembly protein PilZ|nr:PilZ domain-containing protein [Gammaproteobacteria bacterium]MBU0771549.1 PilZ domain-containing protein [Gammaproteobacteria bacterium]MBU0856022.1 PilZ domain-containing protein [Gammaproteobacteria bacterium]MBU1846643.1 PilZ domain-containing protein [Gammaproteobacteria bacterium]